jgi:hypothetical protein
MPDRHVFVAIPQPLRDAVVAQVLSARDGRAMIDARLTTMTPEFSSP